jgi:hypothetical protein
MFTYTQVVRVWDWILCTCVSKEGGDGESADSEALSLLSYTFRYVKIVVYYESRKRELKIKPYF